MNITNLKINKNRIVLPKYSLINPGDKVGFIHDFNMTKLNIYKKEDLDLIIEEFINTVDELKSTKQITYKQYLKIQRYFFGKCLYYDKEVDSNRRISIPKEALNKLDIKDEVLVVNKDKRIELYKDYKTYKNIK